jgi:integrase/recombinase XerD
MKHNFSIKNEEYVKLFKEFDKYIKVVGYKSKSDMYQKQLLEFLWFMERANILSIKEISSLNLLEYYEYLKQRPNLTMKGLLCDSTIASHMITINLFFKLLVEIKILPGVVVLPRKLVRNKNERNTLTKEEIELLFAFCENKKDKAILALAYGCGLRRTEIEDLKVQDIFFTKRLLIVRKGKNSKRREIPLSTEVIKILKDYLLNERTQYLVKKNGLQDAFLLSIRGTVLRGEDINRRLKIIIKRTNCNDIIYKNITLHCLRHSIAVHLIENNASFEFVRDFLGHEEINTTHIYAKRRRLKNQLEIIAR